MKTKRGKPSGVNVITLGCSKNLVDSENLMTQLSAGGIHVAHESSNNFSTVVINTCGFIGAAKKESVDTILEQVELKKRGKVEKVIVTGCLSERYGNELRLEIPEVDGWFGTHDLPVLLKSLGTDYRHELIGERKQATPSHYAYLKISEGCNRTCAFCAIPLMRGKHVSRTVEEILQEAGNLATQGVKEIILIAQELTFYGLDIYKKRKLAHLLRELDKTEGIEWIRLHYAYPSSFPMEVADVIRESEKTCRYLDIPLQHASDKVLKMMRRQTDQAYMQTLIDTLRKKIPGLALRTTMLVGFPGETEKDFETLLTFVQRNRFERLGVFEYSHEEGTSGFELADDVPAEVKRERASRLMELQESVSLDFNRSRVGKTLKVLFDRKEGGYFVGRTEHDSPEVDNEVMVGASSYLRTGDFAKIRITDATEFDLFGEVAEAPPQGGS